MSEATFRVIPPSEPYQVPVNEWERIKPRSCHCGFCGANLSIRKYADHIDRHRANGFKPRPVSVPKRSAAEVFTEWQATDATDAEVQS